MAVLSACIFATLLAVSAAGTCDGKDFACNHTDHKFAIEHVYMESNSKKHWKADDTVHIKMSGHVDNFDLKAGTLHYKIWEFGVEHFRTAGALDYFVCGPPPKPCNKAHGKALHLAVPNDLTSSIRISYVDLLSNVQPAVRATLPCDGPDYACNHTDTEMAITTVEIVSSSGVRWKAGDTVTITMQGHIKGHNITAGTLHYKIWEFGVEHFRTAGALDYFVCGPPPKPCDKSKPRALRLTKPSSLNSGFEMRIRVPLPPKMKSGTMTIDLWGEDQDHEPYDFTSEIRLSYTSRVIRFLLELLRNLIRIFPARIN